MKKPNCLKSYFRVQKTHFSDVVTIAEAFGFRRPDQRQSSYFCSRANSRIGKFAEEKGKAVPYQVKTTFVTHRTQQSSNGGRIMKDYHVNLFYSDEDEGYIADIPDLKHCSAFGVTPEDALREVLQAKKAWIEAAIANGKPVPEPRFRPLIYQAAWIIFYESIVDAFRRVSIPQRRNLCVFQTIPFLLY